MALKWDFMQRGVGEEARPLALPGQSARRARMREYYDLVKPGVVYGNMIVALAAYFFATRFAINANVFCALIIGLAFVIGSAAIFNNYFDRRIDALMERTKSRALARGTIPVIFALVFAAILGIVGFGVLYTLANPLSAYCALAGFLVYVCLYGPAKRATPWGVLPGVIAGAIPALVGYAAATGTIDMAAILIFAILCIWQLPHFFAIAIYRFDEYAVAGIPTVPIKIGIAKTKYAIATTIILFTAAIGLVPALGYAGGIYAIAMALVCGLWFASALRGFSTTDDTPWARRLFYISLIVIFAFAVLLAVGPLLP